MADGGHRNAHWLTTADPRVLCNTIYVLLTRDLDEQQLNEFNLRLHGMEATPSDADS